MRKPFEQRSGRGSRRWLPPGLPQGWADDASVRYVVVDEVLEGSVTLAVSRWPELDRRGRLRFGQTSPLSVSVEHAKLAQVLGSRVLPEESGTQSTAQEVADRPVRVGDVFAVREIRPLSTLLRRRSRAGGPGRTRFVDPQLWLDETVYDLTAVAREAAKLAYYAAASIPVGRSEVEARIAGELQPRPPDPFDLLGQSEA
jgi:hypothetical protein